MRPRPVDAPVPSIFSRIIAGELPGRFVWSDDDVVAFLTIAPISPGHTLVVPRQEVDHWLDLDDDLIARIHVVGKRIGQALDRAWSPARVVSVIAGFEVPHMHLHVLAAHQLADIDFRRANPDTPAEELDAAADRLRVALRELGHGAHVPEP